MLLKTPDGEPADSIDKIMLLAIWSQRLAEEKHPMRPYIISACMGKPTFPISQYAAQSGVDYWNKWLLKSQQARQLLTSGNYQLAQNKIANIHAAIDYGDPRGDFDARIKMAAALTRWYDSKVLIKPEHILYTVGGAGALHNIFNAINRRIPNGIIVTPFPHYGLYTGPHGKNRLFPIPVMEETGYRLTDKLMAKSIEAAKAQAIQEGIEISAILICDPSNPMGTALNEDELKKIACVLKKHPDIFIILDEAYAEMRLTGRHALSLLNVAPELFDRIILMRSATKALSAAGERMAITVAFNPKIMSNLIQESIGVYGHAPRSSQYIFAEAMEKLDKTELDNLRHYYKPQVEYVSTRLLKMGAAMPDPHYRVGGTFYVMANLQDLLGQKIPSTAMRALGKQGRVTTDEELVYSLLFDIGIAIAPLSYFGASAHQGYVRITCSGGQQELAELMDRLENQLILTRKARQQRLSTPVWSNMMPQML